MTNGVMQKIAKVPKSCIPVICLYCSSLAFMINFAPGAAGVLVGYPFDTAKVQIQTSEAGTYRGTFHCLFVCMR